MLRLKSWLARRVAGLIASDPEAARIVAEAVREPIEKHFDRTLLDRLQSAQRRFG